jgi:ADP-ribose pyrophosphatase
MSGPHAEEVWTGPVADSAEPRPVTGSAVRFDGRVWSVITEDVDFGGASAARDLILHPGAVAVIALDDDERVLLIRQYRHAVGGYLFEPPAGLLDAPDEDPWATAVRELAEEAGYAAQEWHVLLDQFMTPGGSSEAIRVYLARGLSPLPEGREHTGEAEEAHLPRAWVPLDEARDLVLGGAVGSPTAVTGILGAWAARAAGWASLRPADAPWPARERLLAAQRVRLPRPPVRS